MSVEGLDRVFAPRRIAVVGASENPTSVGGIILANLTENGFSGEVHPVNPRHERLAGRRCFRGIGDVPGPVDVAIVCTPAATVPGVVRECGEAGVTGVVVISAGFREVGPDGAQLERQVSQAASEFDLRIIGPNCLGYLVPSLGLNASFGRARPQPGHVAVISQSGALATALLDWAGEEGIGFSAVVSTGNMLDVDVGDLIDHFAQDPRTEALMLYLESITGARKFMSAARAFARVKPIVAYKAGRFAQSAAAAVSHTGAMAGADDVYDAAFRRAGIVRVDELGDIFDAAELLGRAHRPRDAALAILTNAGGPGVMAADALLARRGALAELSEGTIGALSDVLPAAWSRGNPVDVLGDAGPDRYVAALRALVAEPDAAAVLVLLTPQAMTEPTAIAEALASEAERMRKPVLAAWMGGDQVLEGRARLEAAEIPCYETPEQAVGAFMHLVSYARNRELLYETPRAIPLRFALDRHEVHGLLTAFLLQDKPVLAEAQSKALLEAYGIPVTRPRIAHDAGEAAEVAEEVGFPVVLKVRSDEITHKTDVGGVITNVQSATGVHHAFERIMEGAKRGAPEAHVDGISVQEMVTGPGQELIVGARKDPTFGAVIMVGAGGVAAEIAADALLELPPLNERLARRMVEGLRMWPLLSGFRGDPVANLDLLLEILIRFSYLVADYPEIAEVEINPLHVGPERVVALDARVVLDEDVLRHSVAPYSHLAIRPYPDELSSRTALKDGRSIVLRPIRPEDEPLWQAMLSAASAESIRSRFRGVFRHESHQMASRYCFIDYDREMAIVAELEEADGPRLIGVGRLVADPDRREAEYAAFVADPWQGLGLSNVLTDRCLEIARGWGVQRVWAETDPDNRRMLAVFRARRFQLDSRSEPGVVQASLELGSAAPAG